MNNLNTFFDNKNQEKIITLKKIININNKNKKDKVKGHVVVLISIEEKCLKLLNSYGETYGDKKIIKL